MSSLRVRARIAKELHKSPENTKHIIVNGAGFLAPFYFGIFDYLDSLEDSKRNKCIPEGKTKFFTVSAGNLAVIAQFFLTKEKRNELLEEVSLVSKELLGWGLFGNLSWLREFLLRICPDDAHIQMRDKHVVIVGEWPGSIQLLSNFETKEDYVEAIICSCAIPGFVYRPLVLNGSLVYDFGAQGYLHFIDDLFDTSFRVRTPKIMSKSCWKNCICPGERVGHPFWSRGDEFNKWLYSVGKIKAERYFSKVLEAE